MQSVQRLLCTMLRIYYISAGGKQQDRYCSDPRNFLNRSVCYYHVTYAFRSDSTLCSCLNVKELLVRNRRDIWSLSDSNEIRHHNHWVRKWTLSHLAKLAKMPRVLIRVLILLFAGQCVFHSTKNEVSSSVNAAKSA